MNESVTDKGPYKRLTPQGSTYTDEEWDWMEDNCTKAREKRVSLGSMQGKDTFRVPRKITSIFQPMTNTSSSAKGVLTEKSVNILVERAGPINDNLALRDRRGDLDMNENNETDQLETLQEVHLKQPWNQQLRGATH